MRVRRHGGLPPSLNHKRKGSRQVLGTRCGWLPVEVLGKVASPRLPGEAPGWAASPRRVEAEPLASGRQSPPLAVPPECPCRGPRWPTASASAGRGAVTPRFHAPALACHLVLRWLVAGLRVCPLPSRLRLLQPLSGRRSRRGSGVPPSPSLRGTTPAALSGSDFPLLAHEAPETNSTCLRKEAKPILASWLAGTRMYMVSQNPQSRPRHLMASKGLQ